MSTKAQNVGRDEVIRAMIAEGKSDTEIARVFTISPARVWQIRNDYYKKEAK